MINTNIIIIDYVAINATAVAVAVYYFASSSNHSCVEIMIQTRIMQYELYLVYSQRRLFKMRW